MDPIGVHDSPYPQSGVVPLTTGGRIGLVPGPVPGIKDGGGGDASPAEKLRIDAELTEYVMFPLGVIQATWFGCVR